MGPERAPETRHSGTAIFKDATQRPVHLRLRFILLVFCGGALGTAARQGLILLLPHASGIPWTIVAINLVGALALGGLLESLIRRGADIGQRRFARLLLGTGFLGGFTTYSALATDTALLISNGDPASAILYSAGSVIAGLITAFIGVVLAAALHRGRQS